MDSFNKNTEEFTHWLKSTANVVMSDDIAIKDLRDSKQGRALVALADIKEGTVLFEIPRSSILNVETGKISTLSENVKDKLLHKIGHWEGLVLSILYELKTSEETSFWGKYFNVLPDIKEPKPFDNLLYWDEEELEYLTPSFIVNRIGKEQSQNMYEDCKKIVGKLNLDLTFSWEEFLYVASLIMSYSFDIERSDFTGEEEQDEDSDEKEVKDTEYGAQSMDVYKDGSYKSMVPLADMLNADSNLCNANLNHSETHLVMVATQDISKGEQIYNTYGEHPNSELLRRYGYVEWEGSQYDFGEFTMVNVFIVLSKLFNKDQEEIGDLLETISDDPVILEILEGEELVLETYDCYNDGNILTEGVCLVQILCLMLEFNISTETKNFDKMLTKCIKLVNKNKITTKCDMALKEILKLRLSEYPEDSLTNIITQPTSNYYESMAKKVLNSESQSIHNCLDSLDTDYKVVPDEDYIPEMMGSLESSNSKKRHGTDNNDAAAKNIKKHKC